MKGDTFITVMMWFCGFMMAFCIFGMYMSITTSKTFYDECLAKHGVPYSAKGHHICLRENTVVPL